MLPIRITHGVLAVYVTHGKRGQKIGGGGGGRGGGGGTLDLQKVERVHRGGLNSGKIPECLGDAALVTKDDERALAADVPPVTHLTLAPPDVT